MPPTLRSIVLVLCALVAASPADALDLTVHGYVDARAVVVDGQPNWMQGGYGKLRFGADDDGLRPAAAAVFASLQLGPAWLAAGTAQLATGDGNGVELLDAWLRYRPVSLTPRRWSLRLGLFFPPISLENDAIGWTSPNTLTPSAINSWVGEELRCTGLEWRLEQRGASQTVELALALFGGNDPAGEQLAARGWSLSDRVYGLGGSLREPDPSSREAPPPRRFDPFVEIDHRLGAYAELVLRRPALGRGTLLLYDNRADPSQETSFAGQDVYGWRTRLMAAGIEHPLREWRLLGQVMRGTTEIAPSPRFHSRTHFWAGYLELAQQRGRWRPAARVDLFGTRAEQPGDGGAREHGHALTVALGWRPQPQWRVSAEWLLLDSERNSRDALGLDRRQREQLLQLSLRYLF